MQTQQPTAQDFKIQLERQSYKVDVLERFVDGLKGELKKYQPTVSHPGISFASTTINDPLQQARIEHEIIEKSEKLFHEKNAYNALLQHANQHDAIKKQKEQEIEALTKEANENFESVLSKARAMSENKEVAKLLRNYDAGKLEILKDQTSKNKFYTDLKTPIA